MGRFIVVSLTRDKRCTAGIGHNAFPSCVNGLQATDYRLHAVKDGLGANGIGMHKFQQKYKKMRSIMRRPSLS